jgi:O-antigen ligase
MIQQVDHKLMWLFLALIGIVPFLIRLKIIDFASPKIIMAILDTGQQSDLFSYYKWVFLLCLAIIAIVFLMFKILVYKYELRKFYINIPLFLLVLFVIISLVSAEYKGISLVGLYKQHDGTLTYLSYFALFFVAANTIIKEWFSKYLIIILGIIISIDALVVLSSFFGKDLFQFTVIKSLFIPHNLHSYMSGSFTSLLSNQNYDSGMAAAFFAFFFAFVLLETRIKQYLLYLIFLLVSFAVILGSLSSSGFVSVVIISPLIVAVAFLSRQRKQTLMKAGAAFVLCIIVFILMNAHNPRVYEETLGSTCSIIQPIQEVGINNQAESQSDKITKEVTASESDIFRLPAQGHSAGNGRVYIWNETLKLIQKKTFTGYGQDTLSYYFPQNDINKIAGLGTYNTLISKPHNLYLGIAYGSGIPAMLTLLYLFFMHFYRTGQYLIKAERNHTVILPAALFLFFCAFTVQWLFNDSVIGSAAIFWTLLGISVSLHDTI